MNYLLRALGLGVALLLLGCQHFPTCRNNHIIQTAKLRTTWKLIETKQDDPKLLKHWIESMLDSILAGGRYQLTVRRKRFYIVEEFQQDRLCRVPLEPQFQAFAPPDFLQRLYRIVQQKRVSLDEKYIYVPPKFIVVSGDASGNVNHHLLDGACAQRQYQIDLAYWKAISDKRAQATWKEACQLGKKLTPWEPCFKPRISLLYRKRMPIVCGTSSSTPTSAN